jgi:hypothetical protein
MRFELWQGAECLLEHMAPAELLAWDEWNGPVSLQEILAAFVMRNHLPVERLLRGPPISWGTARMARCYSFVPSAIDSSPLLCHEWHWDLM